MRPLPPLRLERYVRHAGILGLIDVLGVRSGVVIGPVWMFMRGMEGVGLVDRPNRDKPMREDGLDRA